MSEHEGTSGTAVETTRRDFLYLTTGALGAVGAVGVAWPFINQMRPDASTLALASVEVDVSSLEPGMSMTVKWRGKPVFIRNRTPEEIEASRNVPVSELKDPLARNANIDASAEATDVARSAGEGKENWLVMVGVCTHLGCIPLGQSGEYNGWFCPCHGSAYDTSGRIRQGPAPENMLIPVFEFTSDTVIKVG
ncbi:ubiquinol-cytochrome c reductase iron-sulfur subunit [Rhizobiaceae bacterium BDR2-2]|uniref:Ubiquinol-cytochrome c reductase iron-sulfur subunit n=1 Tax=Ectorhizobium quercum TaxID=2965071 RepID=A0AAE3N0H2_9HYPH|nr:ubiquinol-cytochrome c reductase iron-sulfur subunit [Ectorhizobium quercum]MCX8996587.1 ubiquinol-cytochrome c reductase iron-sulfur subunit [Ectorhizobium quercum]